MFPATFLAGSVMAIHTTNIPVGPRHQIAQVAQSSSSDAPSPSEALQTQANIKATDKMIPLVEWLI